MAASSSHSACSSSAVAAPFKQRAHEFYVARVVGREPREALVISIHCGNGMFEFSPFRALRGRAIASIKRWPSRSFLFGSPSAAAAPSRLPGSALASAAAIVQRQRASGIGGHL